MKRLQSEVKAASEKQQTNAHHRESGGERWRRRVETDSERHLAEDNLISQEKENTATQQACPPETTLPESSHAYPAPFYIHEKYGVFMRIP